MKTTQKQLIVIRDAELYAYEESHEQRARKLAARANDTIHRFRQGWEPVRRVDRSRQRRSVRVEMDA